MIAAACFGTNDLDRAAQFYDGVLETVGMTRTVSTDNEFGYGTKGNEPVFWALRPFDGEAATHGNGAQVLFAASAPEMVNRFHERAIALGGADEGAPGLRDHTPGYYGAYCRDLDGNKLHVYVIQE